MKSSTDGGSGDGYPRPNQPWQCGLGDEGSPCPLGPSAFGHCPAAAACKPVHQGDRWVCNRGELRGGACETGPGPDGSCCLVYQCTPRRSLRSRRGRFVVGVALAAVGTMAMTMSASWRNEVIAPGPLSTHHAQLVARTSNTMRCGSCHAAGNAAARDWLAHTHGSQTLRPPQAALCLECHQRDIAPEFALAAHNVPVDRLLVSGDSTASRRRDPAEPIACAACHREHQGVEQDLTAIDNKSCQACHAERYHSFATDHPDFSDWPFSKTAHIAFDHASHEGKHFPAEKQSFSCTMCHQSDETGRGQMTLGYEEACATCHDKSIGASLTDGVPLLSLPMLDTELLEEAGVDVGIWPESATGDFDGKLPSMLQLLLAGDKRIAAASQMFGRPIDLYEVDVDNPAHLQAAGDSALAIKELAADLAERGHEAMSDRLEAALDRKLAPGELASLAGRLSPDTLTSLQQEWFGEGVGPDAAEASADQLAGGGWLRDDGAFALKFQPTGHADPWLRAWIDAAISAANGPHRNQAEPVLTQLLGPTAAGLCATCHTPEQNAAGEWSIRWHATRPDAKPTGFTHFSHAPHLVQPQLAQCTSCHEIESSIPTFASSPGFAPMARKSCAECHTPRGAGDRCTQCHKYHVGVNGRRTLEDRTMDLDAEKSKVPRL